MIKLLKIFLIISFSLLLMLLLAISFFDSNKDLVNEDFSMSISKLKLDSDNKNFYLSGDILTYIDDNQTGTTISGEIYYHDYINPIDSIYYSQSGSYDIKKDGYKNTFLLKEGLFFLDFNDIAIQNNIFLSVLKNDNKQKNIDIVLSFEGVGKLFVLVTNKYTKIFSLNSTIKVSFISSQGEESLVNTHYLFPHDYFNLTPGLQFKDIDFSRIKTISLKYIGGKIKDIDSYTKKDFTQEGFIFIVSIIKNIVLLDNSKEKIRLLNNIKKIEFKGKDYLESQFLLFSEKKNLTFLFNKEKLISYYRVNLIKNLLDLLNLKKDLSIDERKTYVKNIYDNMQKLKLISEVEFNKLNDILNTFYYNILIINDVNELYRQENFLNLYLSINIKDYIGNWTQNSIYAKLKNIFYNFDFLDYTSFNVDYLNFLNSFIIDYNKKNNNNMIDLKVKNNLLSIKSNSNLDTLNLKLEKYKMTKDDYFKVNDYINLGESFLNNLNNYSNYYLLNIDSNDISNDINILSIYLEFTKIVYFGDYSSEILKITGLLKNQVILEKINNYLFGCNFNKIENNYICDGNILKPINDDNSCLEKIDKKIFTINNTKDLLKIKDGFKLLYDDNKNLLLNSSIDLNMDGLNLKKYIEEYLKLFDIIDLSLFALSDYNGYKEENCSLLVEEGDDPVDTEEKIFGVTDIFNFLSLYKFVKLNYLDISKNGEDNYRITSFEINDGNQKVILTFDIDERFSISNIKLVSSTNDSNYIENILKSNPEYDLELDKINMEEKYKNTTSKDREKFDYRNFFKSTFLLQVDNNLLENQENTGSIELINYACDRSNLVNRVINDNYVGVKGVFYQTKQILNVKLDEVCLEIGEDKKIKKQSILNSKFFINIEGASFSADFNSEFNEENNKILFGIGGGIKLVISIMEEGKYLEKIGGNIITIKKSIYLNDLQTELEYIFKNLNNIESAFNTINSLNNDEKINILSERSDLIVFYTVISGKNVEIILRGDQIVKFSIEFGNNLVARNSINISLLPDFIKENL